MYCENNIDECFSSQCVDGKQCLDLINGYECRCPVGFTGHLCQKNINDCVANLCQNVVAPVSMESAITLALVLLDSLDAIVRKISTNVPS